MSAYVDGKEVNIGDWVCFKSDLEQSGQILGIKTRLGGKDLVLVNEAGFIGEYIGGDTRTLVRAVDCWLD